MYIICIHFFCFISDFIVYNKRSCTFISAVSYIYICPYIMKIKFILLLYLSLEFYPKVQQFGLLPKNTQRKGMLNLKNISLIFMGPCIINTGVQLKSGPYFNMSNLFTKIYNMLYYTPNLYLQ
jgi:hypothetical protein